MPRQRAMRRAMPAAVLLLLLVAAAAAAEPECPVRLPLLAARVLDGHTPRPRDFDSAVGVGLFADGAYATCSGVLLSDAWVVTSAQCLVGIGHFVSVGAVGSVSGRMYRVNEVFNHAGFDEGGRGVVRDDIALLKVSPDSAGLGVPAGVELEPERPDADPVDTLDINYMKVNTNKQFGMPAPDTPNVYLRTKGYGLTVPPRSGKDAALLDVPRNLAFADVRTASCAGDIGNDGGKRLCTRARSGCGPCHGDVGAPLYDVDSSGGNAVLVGIVTFGARSIDPSSPRCQNKNNPTIYTAIAEYVPWMKEQGASFTEFRIPTRGLTNTTIAPEDRDDLGFGIRLSPLVIAGIAIFGAVFLLVVVVVALYLLRKRRRAKLAGDEEDAWINGDLAKIDSADPFEGIGEESSASQRSVIPLAYKTAKNVGDFSSRSLGAFKAKLGATPDSSTASVRSTVEGEPSWLSGRWEQLINPSVTNPFSRDDDDDEDDVDGLRRLATQKMVHDVLEGANYEIEPSLESVAQQNARAEEELEAAWKTLEAKASKRVLLDVDDDTAEDIAASSSRPVLKIASKFSLRSLSTKGKSAKAKDGEGQHEKGQHQQVRPQPEDDLNTFDADVEVVDDEHDISPGDSFSVVKDEHLRLSPRRLSDERSVNSSKRLTSARSNGSRLWWVGGSEDDVTMPNSTGSETWNEFSLDVTDGVHVDTDDIRLDYDATSGRKYGPQSVTAPHRQYDVEADDVELSVPHVEREYSPLAPSVSVGQQDFETDDVNLQAPHAEREYSPPPSLVPVERVNFEARGKNDFGLQKQDSKGEHSAPSASIGNHDFLRGSTDVQTSTGEAEYGARPEAVERALFTSPSRRSVSTGSAESDQFSDDDMAIVPSAPWSSSFSFSQVKGFFVDSEPAVAGAASAEQSTSMTELDRARRRGIRGVEDLDPKPSAADILTPRQTEDLRPTNNVALDDVQRDFNPKKRQVSNGYWDYPEGSNSASKIDVSALRRQWSERLRDNR